MATTLSSKISSLRFPSQCEDANDIWVNMAETIRKVAGETLGVSTEKLKVFKESWWWKDEVQNNIKDKNKRFKEHMTCTEEEERYKRERATKKQNGR